mmetsp:Transcript_35056/g.63066  ORF Transcript_35056/g.63066 Transcript_35056/m.63066 type:complete len:554 (-) Transcript_35056:179-1840(-)
MEYDPAEYQKLVIRRRAPTSTEQTNEGKYWRRYKAPVVSKQFGAVSHLDYCPLYPYNLAVTASTRVSVYNGRSKDVDKTISRFQDVAYSGNYRNDGKLITAGCQNGVVQVFDVASRTILRQFKGHQRASRVALFASDKLHLMSGSDDVTLRYWDISTGDQVQRLDGHADYVRAAAASPVDSHTWISGSYDHTCRIWDVRTQGAAVMNLDHGAPVEDVKFLPSAGLAVSAGGNHVCVWDLTSGGRLVKRLSGFQKTVSSLCVSPAVSIRGLAESPRLLVGALDGHLKVLDLDSFSVVHVSRYPSPILSLAMSPDAANLAVGLADSTLSIRAHATRAAATESAVFGDRFRFRVRARSGKSGSGGGLSGWGKSYGGKDSHLPWKPALNASNYRYFLRGQGAAAAEDDFQIAKQRAARLRPYDKLLRQFRYSAALDAALATHNKEVVSSILEELMARGGGAALAGALGGRDATSLLPVLQFISRSLTMDPPRAKIVASVLHAVLDLYGGVVGLDPAVDRELMIIRQRTGEELGLVSQLTQLAGALEPILAASLGAMA